MKQGQDGGEDAVTQSEEEYTLLPRLGLGAAEAFASNLVTNVAARYIGDAGFAKISPTTIYNHMNLSAWRWEKNDRFYVNQAGHPYQGSTYFNSGRSNGFSFYESIGFTAVGSVVWESVFETGICSLNDFVTTTIGGAAVGEMLHRLFIESDRDGTIGGKIGSTFASPADRLTALITNRKPSIVEGNLYEVSLGAGLGWTSADFSTGSLVETMSVPNTLLDVQVVYGNPFEQDGMIPYQQFELSAFINGGMKSVENRRRMWYDSRVISDGYLFVFSSESDDLQTSAGLTLHFDYFNLTDDIADNARFAGLAFSADSLDLTVKRRTPVGETAFFDMKTHIGWLMWGTSTYWVNVPPYQVSMDEEYYNYYGTGINIQLFLTFSSQHWGTLRRDMAAYMLYGWGGGGGKGNVFYTFTDTSYSRKLGKRFSIGVGWSCARLAGYYDEAPNGLKSVKTRRIFSEWRL
ncbi:MAG: DUF3943 domain-containing protein [Treponema sp.]|nr:DUF3943 domain-containing protein [Treponema sp.]